MTESTPATPEPPSDGISAAPDEPANAPAEPVTAGSETPTTSGPVPEPSRDQATRTPQVDPPGTAGTGPPEVPVGAGAGGGRGGCMTTMIGLFVILAALLGIATQL